MKLRCQEPSVYDDDCEDEGLEPKALHNTIAKLLHPISQSWLSRWASQTRKLHQVINKGNDDIKSIIPQTFAPQFSNVVEASHDRVSS